MTANPYDKASRYAIRLDPLGLLCWLLGIGPSDLRFRGWLDARMIAFPGEPDRICDTVARIEDVRRGHVPWAVPIEFQLAPDPDIFGRMMEYLGKVWRQLRPDEERGSRYWVGAVVLNLTGEGESSRDLIWPEVGLRTHLAIVERNLSAVAASEVLAGIAGGTIAPCVLPWIPLMQGGGEAGMLSQWKDLAQGEPDPRKRGDYGSLALVFAEAAGCRPVWKDSLKEWEMTQSLQVLEWQTEARVDQAAKQLLRLLELRFSPIPLEVPNAIREEKDLEKLTRWFDIAVICGSVEAFRQAAQL